MRWPTLPATAAALALFAVTACARTEPVFDADDAGEGAPTETPTVSACLYIGGIDRFMVNARWARAGECLQLVFVDVDMPTTFAYFRAPTPWRLDAASASTQSCSPTRTFALQSASGELTFTAQAGHGLPTRFTLRGQFGFIDLAGEPRALQLDVQDVAVSPEPCHGPF